MLIDRITIHTHNINGIFVLLFFEFIMDLVKITDITAVENLFFQST